MCFKCWSTEHGASSCSHPEKQENCWVEFYGSPDKEVQAKHTSSGNNKDNKFMKGSQWFAENDADNTKVASSKNGSDEEYWGPSWPPATQQDRSQGLKFDEAPTSTRQTVKEEQDDADLEQARPPLPADHGTPAKMEDSWTMPNPPLPHAGPQMVQPWGVQQHGAWPQANDFQMAGGAPQARVKGVGKGKSLGEECPFESKECNVTIDNNILVSANGSHLQQAHRCAHGRSMLITSADFNDGRTVTIDADSSSAEFDEDWKHLCMEPVKPTGNEVAEEAQRYKVMTRTHDPVQIHDQCLWLNGAKKEGSEDCGKVEFFNGTVHAIGYDRHLNGRICILVS